MEENSIVGDVIDSLPKGIIQVSYPSGVNVNMGNELTPTSVKDEPIVQWTADPNSLYTLVMVDPDAPSRAEPTLRECKHWLVINIPGNRVSEGQTLAEYMGSGPPEGTGLHRYVFLVYKQNKRIETSEPFVSNCSLEGRPSFRIKEWARDHNLGQPVAANFYLAQFDDYVPILHKKFGYVHNK